MYDQKVATKNQREKRIKKKSWERKELLRWNKKHFSSFSKDFQSSKKQIFLEGESPTLSGIVESKNVSGKQMMSMFFALINASIRSTLTKSWAAIPLRFQWQKFSLEDFIWPKLISMSFDCNNSK